MANRIVFFSAYVFAATAFMTACSPVYHVPATQNVPLLMEKGQGRVAAFSDGGSAEIQGSYALSNSLGLQLNTGFYFPANEDNGNGGSGQYIEAGLGYFTPISADGKLVFETYGLLGTGGLENHFPSTVQANPGTTGTLEAKAFRYGIQPALGFRSDFFEAAASARLMGINYSDPQGSLIFDNEDQVQYLKDHPSQLVLEPALTLRAGLDWGKIQLQYAHSINLSDDTFRQSEGHLTIGLIFAFLNGGR